ncbi:MAG: M28 family peptidase [Flavobacteriaceae bacterium]|nr:M28 family peptidase [Bacteroidia bacterium]NNL16327.1 M28 family peptidase [Flavobacteriaceae bacterium]
MKNVFLFVASLFCFSAYSQSINDLVSNVSLDSLTLKLNEFSGEVSTIVNGNTVTILNRVSNSDNNLAAEYLLQELNSYNNLNVIDQVYSSGGRNIIAIQEGKTNPDDIYIICAHYDSVANYCADDNASGTTAVLEIARILSTQCTDNTIVYALWDEEEIGLIGAGYYANQAANNGDNILGVLNIDMMAYDGDGDNDFDIDVRDISNSLQIKDDIIDVLNSYSLNLNANVVNPGTTASDHSKFWDEGYSAVLFGEAWSNGDFTPDYHTANDRVSTLNLPYFHEMTKLLMAYTATKGGLVNVDNTVSQNGPVLTANQSGNSYQWINCKTDSPITGATNQSYTATFRGNFAVEITSGTCTEISECKTVNSLGVEQLGNNQVKIFPNPVSTKLFIEFSEFSDGEIELFDLFGKKVYDRSITDQSEEINVNILSKGLYFVRINIDGKTLNYKLIKE